MEVLICSRKIRVYKWEPPEEIWDLLPLSKSIFLYIIIRYMTNKATICGVMRADVKRKWIISMSHSVLLSLSHSDLPSVTVFTWMKRHDFKLLIVQINLVESLWDKLVLVITFITAALNTRSLTSPFFFSLSWIKWQKKCSTMKPQITNSSVFLQSTDTGDILHKMLNISLATTA